jgi:hypothetical protein
MTAGTWWWYPLGPAMRLGILHWLCSLRLDFSRQRPYVDIRCRYCGRPHGRPWQKFVPRAQQAPLCLYGGLGDAWKHVFTHSHACCCCCRCCRCPPPLPPPSSSAPPRDTRRRGLDPRRTADGARKIDLAESTSMCHPHPLRRFYYYYPFSAGLLVSLLSS